MDNTKPGSVNDLVAFFQDNKTPEDHMKEFIKKQVEKIAKWDLRYLQLAKLVSTWSKDPSTQTGAIVVNGNQIVATGYNGFPVLIEDKPELLNDRPEKYKRIIHCEMNAILQADRDDLVGAGLYTWPAMSCERCAVHVIQSGIRTVIFPVKDGKTLMPHWEEQFKVARELFNEAGVSMVGVEWAD